MRGKGRKYPFRLLPLVAATFPKGTASAVAAKFLVQLKGVPLGELANEVSLRGYKKLPPCGVQSGRGEFFGDYSANSGVDR